MNNKPLVSIIIPVYNGANYVAEAIESALAQTYEHLEILVVNDGSTDGGQTDAIVARYEGRVQYFQKPNGGVATALNLGIASMRGEYFSWLSHDDLYLPNKISDQIAFLASLGFPEVVVYSDHLNLFVSSGTSTLTRHEPSADLAFRGRELVAGNRVHGCSLLVPRSAFSKAGVFDEQLRVAQDYELWFRIAQVMPFRYLRATVASCRVHDQQVGVRMSDRVLLENDQFRLSCIQKMSAPEVAALGRGYRLAGLLFLALRMYRLGCPLAHAHVAGAMAEAGRPWYRLDRMLPAALARIVDRCHVMLLDTVRRARAR